MNKARRKVNRIGLSNRLANESLILSCTRFLSSRVVRFFESGLFSPLLTSTTKVDHFVRNKVTGPLFQKMELRKNYTKPARNAISSFILNNSIFQRMTLLRKKFMNASLRSVGIFFLTFGIYAAAIFMLKHYIVLPSEGINTNDIILSAVAAVVGMLLTMFGDKSIMHTLSNGIITGKLLWGVLGVNDITLAKASSVKAKTSVGISFLLGSLTGVLTMFYSAVQLLCALAVIIVAVAIFNIPEFGLMLVFASLAVLPIEQIFIISWITLASYLIKCVRLKRNLRFGTADALVLIVFLAFLLKFITEGYNAGEQYLLCFSGLYFAAKNMIVSRKLLFQTFNALSIGGFLGMLAYLLGEFSPIIPYGQLSSLANMISANRMDADMLAVLVAIILPVSFYSFSSLAIKKREGVFVLTAIGCAFASDSLAFYGLILFALFIYVAIAYKAPVGSIIGALAVVPFALWILGNFTLSNSVSLFSQSSYDSALMSDNTAASFWRGAVEHWGIVTTVIFALSLPFVLQRIIKAVVFAKERSCSLLCGVVGASAFVMLFASVAFNLFADLRMICVLWLILGLCGSTYRIYRNENTNREEYIDAEA